ncbi:hypothetical protein HPP92_027008 [Vanilla planifolia]|uniref:Uncharacterized protein n=1 Tax=Vanilla planifolia TaxID=51239 RepID=A0A835PBW8_VANPL|nr:hypothetical protein HPP92_027008 [Vanilla planifolia]
MQHCYASSITNLNGRLQISTRSNTPINIVSSISIDEIIALVKRKAIVVIISQEINLINKPLAQKSNKVLIKIARLIPTNGTIFGLSTYYPKIKGPTLNFPTSLFKSITKSQAPPGAFLN